MDWEGCKDFYQVRKQQLLCFLRTCISSAPFLLLCSFSFNLYRLTAISLAGMGGGGGVPGLGAIGQALHSQLQGLGEGGMELRDVPDFDPNGFLGDYRLCRCLSRYRSSMVTFDNALTFIQCITRCQFEPYLPQFFMYISLVKFPTNVFKNVTFPLSSISLFPSFRRPLNQSLTARGWDSMIS